MKKILVLLAFVLATALLFCGCDGTTSNGENTPTNGKAVEMTEQQLFRLDAVNYDISDIEGVKKLGDSGVIYAYCSSAESVNQTVELLDQLPDSDLNKYSEDDKNLVLTLITLGDGKNASYSIEKIEIGERAALYVYVKTNEVTEDEKRTGEYHFARLGVPVCGEITVYLDGVQVGK